MGPGHFSTAFITPDISPEMDEKIVGVKYKLDWWKNRYCVAGLKQKFFAE